MKNLKKKLTEFFMPQETIPIYWDDLTPAKQSELLAALGDNGNYDVFPIAVVPVPRRVKHNA